MKKNCGEKKMEIDEIFCSLFFPIFTVRNPLAVAIVHFLEHFFTVFPCSVLEKPARAFRQKAKSDELNDGRKCGKSKH